MINQKELLGLQHKHISVATKPREGGAYPARLRGAALGHCYREQAQWRFEMDESKGYPAIIARGKTKPAAVRAAVDRLVALGKQINRVLSDT